MLPRNLVLVDFKLVSSSTSIKCPPTDNDGSYYSSGGKIDGKQIQGWYGQIRRPVPSLRVLGARPAVDIFTL